MKDENVKRALIHSVLQYDLGDCPYYTRSGENGAYGPNTCSHSCHEEPSCITNEPTNGWIWTAIPQSVRDWLVEWDPEEGEPSNEDEEESDPLLLALHDRNF